MDLLVLDENEVLTVREPRDRQLTGNRIGTAAFRRLIDDLGITIFFNVIDVETAFFNIAAFVERVNAEEARLDDERQVT